MDTKTQNIFSALSTVCPHDIAEAFEAGFSENEIAFMFRINRSRVHRLISQSLNDHQLRAGRQLH